MVVVVRGREVDSTTAGRGGDSTTADEDHSAVVVVRFVLVFVFVLVLVLVLVTSTDVVIRKVSPHHHTPTGTWAAVWASMKRDAQMMYSDPVGFAAEVYEVC